MKQGLILNKTSKMNRPEKNLSKAKNICPIKLYESRLITIKYQ